MSFPTPEPAPFNWASPYNPAASMGFDPSGMGGLVAPLMTQFLSQFAGPGNFLPHQNPAQAITDQLAMRQYFNTTQANNATMSRMGTGRMAATMGGVMSAFTGQPLTDLNRQQAHYMAGIVNNPHLKPVLAAAMGPENFEAAFFGTAGDPSMLGNAANRVGYYRPDPATGARRMGAQSLEDFSSSLYATMYEPSGNLDEMVSGARKGDGGATRRLQTAARAQHESVVGDDDLTRRIADLGDAEVERIYKKYQPSGSATTAADRARELTQFDRAVQEAGVLGANETSVTSLQRRAERAAVESMHGFSAGQSGQVMEHLFQRGQLPQSIGALSAADRVRVLSEQNLDSETMSRLTRQFGHRELMENNSEYANAFNAGNQAKVDEIFESHRGDYERRIGGSLRKIKERQKTGGPIGADEAEELLAMDGMDSMASNIDAGRSSAAIKKNTEALAAIRQIFGDNGNPNAPVPALLAALDHLSQGAGVRGPNAGRVASTLREMRGMAKEMGMGFDQMANMAGAIGAYGDQLGLAGETKVQAQANAMGMVNRMRREGAFSNERFGMDSQAEAERKSAMIATRTEASVVAKGTAAIRRIYDQNKEKHKDTELGEIARRLEEDPNWDGSYEWNGEKKNYYTAAADPNMGGARYFSGLATASGETSTFMNTVMQDYDSQQFGGTAAGMKGMKADMFGQIANLTTDPMISQSIERDPTSALNDGSKKATDARRAVSVALTGMIVDSADQFKDPKDHLKYLEENVEAEFARTLQANGYSEEEAKAEAKKLMDTTFGTDPETRRSRMIETVARTNTAIQHQTNGEFHTAAQLAPYLRAGSRIGDERARSGREAQQAHEAGLFYQGTPMARASDYLAEISQSGEAFNFDRMLQATFGITPDSEMRKRLAPELAGAFQEAYEKIESATVTDKYVEQLIAGSAEDHTGTRFSRERADEELMTLATRGMSEEQAAEFKKKHGKIVGDDVIKQRREDKLEALSGDDLKKLYDTHAARDYGAADTDEKRRENLRKFMRDGGELAGFDDASLIEEGETTRQMLGNQVVRGTARHEGNQEMFEERRRQGRTEATALYGRNIREIRAGARSRLEAIGGLDVDKLLDLGMYEDGDTKKKDEFDAMLAGMSEEQRAQVDEIMAAHRGARDAHLAEYLPVDDGAGGPAGAGGRKPHPGSPEAGKDVAEGKSDGPAATAREKKKEGPVTGDAADKAAEEEKKKRGPGAETARDVATEGTTPAPKPGEPGAPDITPAADTATPAPSSATPASGADAPHPGGEAAKADVEDKAAERPGDAAKQELQIAGLDGLTGELTKLTEAVTSLEKSFVSMMSPGTSQAKGGDGANSLHKDVARSDRAQAVREAKISQQTADYQRKQSGGGGGGGGGGGNIKGTLTLIGLQSALLSARGSPVFTPTGDGPSIVPGNPVHGAYMSSANVAPVAEA